jgi:predicted AlkP superfamily phosphohydrolase/phosphomutase
MTAKVLIIGIDALDSTTISKHIHHLPNFQKLINSTGCAQFDGVFPPDSPTSWGSIYTGLNPAKHGIVLFVDPLKRVSKMVSKDVDDHTIHGKTFWDIASKAGKKVCILPHLLGYPVWPVNGIMIGRSGVTQSVEAYPEDIKQKINLSDFRWAVDLFPGNDREKYIQLTKDQIAREREFALNLYKNNEFDIFFISFGELDPIQYSFWNYYDEKDPTYPGNNPYKNLIPEFYKIYDDIIGDFWSCSPEGISIIVVSDHGIGSRPVKLFNINEWLRQNNYLKLKTQTNRKTNIIVKLKKSLVNVIDKYNLGNIATFGLRRIPQLKDWFVSNKHINWDDSIAYLTDQSGIKNYPYGGIMVKKIPSMDYDTTRRTIIEGLKKIEDPDSGKRIFNWIYTREEIYEGEFLETYPDILFELDASFGAGTTVPDNLFGQSVSHNIAPGCHKQHHATFLIHSDKAVRKEKITLMDVTPTILHLLSLKTGEYSFDGESIFE